MDYEDAHHDEMAERRSAQMEAEADAHMERCGYDEEMAHRAEMIELRWERDALMSAFHTRIRSDAFVTIMAPDAESATEIASEIEGSVVVLTDPAWTAWPGHVLCHHVGTYRWRPNAAPTWREAEQEDEETFDLLLREAEIEAALGDVDVNR